MKRLLIIPLMLLAVLTVSAQLRNPFIGFDPSDYTEKDSFMLERVQVQFPFEIKAENLPANAESLGPDTYMFQLPHTEKITIRTDAGRTKAIIVFKTLMIGGPFRLPFFDRYEYNIEENDRRIVLWYKDKYTYCGYIYDKYYKVCQYFSDRKGHKFYDKFNRKKFNLYIHG